MTSSSTSAEKNQPVTEGLRLQGIHIYFPLVIAIDAVEPEEENGYERKTAVMALGHQKKREYLWVQW